MLQELWRCFETTGDINLYLGFKEYESLYYSRTEQKAQKSVREVEEIV